MIMKQIKVYEKYAVTDDNRVLGINGKELEPVFLIDSDDKGYQFNDFYRKNDKLFFSTIIMENGTEKIPDSDPVAYVQVPKTHYYVQTGNSLEETEEGLYPLLPESDFIEMGITPWSIVTFDYVNPKTKEKITTSRVVKSIYDEDGKWVKDSPTGFKMIDAYFVVNDGLWFSVPEDIGIRKKGIYFYPLVGNLKSTPVMSGKIW